MTTNPRGPNPDHDPGQDAATHSAMHAAHATRDRTLIAARAAGDLSGPDLARADAVLERCPACRRLHLDLLEIAAATRQLPAPARPRDLDFRISPERAGQLSRGAIWRRLLRPFGRSGSGTVRPLAAAFTTLGLAGLMLAVLPNLQLGGAATGFLAQSGASEAPRDALTESADPEMVRPDGLPTPVRTMGDTAGGESTIDTSSGYGPAATADDKGAPSQGAGGGASDAPGTVAPDRHDEAGAPGEASGDGDLAFGAGSGGPSPLVLLSLGLLGTGLGLFLLRRIALRLR